MRTLSAALSSSLPSIYQHWCLLRNWNVGNKRLICLFNLLNGATRLAQFQSKCGGRVLKRNLPSSLLLSIMSVLVILSFIFFIGNLIAHVSLKFKIIWSNLWFSNGSNFHLPFNDHVKAVSSMHDTFLCLMIWILKKWHK